MNKVYFAGKFNLLKDKELPLHKRLINDYRAKILNDSKRLTYADESAYLDCGCRYLGPFYCEQASNGDYTSTDCNVVLNAEYEAVKNCDTYFAVFDEGFSVGTIVELLWSIQLKKKIIIFYKEEDSNYQIKSEYWFAIADAIKRNKETIVHKFKDIEEVVSNIKKGEIFNEVQRV